MENLIIKATEESPEIYFNQDENYYEIFGRSFPENTINFYKPIQEWIASLPILNQKGEFHIKLNYFNTSSSKHLFKLINAFKRKKVGKIIWYYESEDMDSLNTGKIFSEILDTPFFFKKADKIKSYQKK